MLSELRGGNMNEEPNLQRQNLRMLSLRLGERITTPFDAFMLCLFQIGKALDSVHRPKKISPPAEISHLDLSPSQPTGIQQL